MSHYSLRSGSKLTIWRQVSILLGMLCLIAMVGISPVDAAQGDQDMGFGNNGMQYVELTQILGFANIQSVMIDSNQKFVVAGYTEKPVWIDDGDNEYLILEPQQYVVRLNPDGSPDTSFDGDGLLKQDAVHDGISVMVDAQGRILVGGNTNVETADVDFALVRYTPTGILDTTFAGDGIVTTDFSGTTDTLKALLLTSDQKLIAIGTTLVANKAVLALARYSLDGALDTSFDSDGKLTLDLPNSLQVKHALLDSMGRILVLADFTAEDITNDAYLIRLNLDGTLDTTFNGTGRVTSTLDSANRLTLDANGNILIAGGMPHNVTQSVIVERYTPNGSLDPTFATNGQLIADNFEGQEIANSVALDADGRMLIVGTSGKYYANTAFLVRYTPDGEVDTAFGDHGTHKIQNIYHYSYWFSDLVFDADGNIIALGIEDYNSLSGLTSTMSLIALRYHNGGVPYTQLLANGSFEDVNPTTGALTDWNAKNLPKSKRKCNHLQANPPKILSRTGDCAWLVKGVAGVTGSLTQLIDPALTSSLTAGTLSLSGWMVNVYDVQIIVKVAYAAEKPLKLTLPLNSAFDMSYAYSTTSGELTTTPVKIKVVIKVGNPPTKGWLDDLSVWYHPAESAVESIIPLPLVPLP